MITPSNARMKNSQEPKAFVARCATLRNLSRASTRAVSRFPARPAVCRGTGSAGCTDGGRSAGVVRVEPAGEVLRQGDHATGECRLGAFRFGTAEGARP